MLKFINLKKLTSKTLIGILVTVSLITGTSNKKAFANSCSNNGHGNNAPFTHTLDNGGKLTIDYFDPSNPSASSGKADLIADLVAGVTEKTSKSGGNKRYEISYDGNSSYILTLAEATALVDSHPDWEKTGKNSTKILECSGNDQDGDGINDAVELGGNFNSPLDTDGDGTPNYVDEDSDDDGALDIVEGTLDEDNNGVADYLDDEYVGGVNDDGGNGNDGVTTSSPESLTLTGTIRDFKASHPDFESTIGTDRGIVTAELGSDKKPIYAHGSAGTLTTNGKTYFDQWYRDVSGVNLSKEHSITLSKQGDGTYKYQDHSFFPINNELFGNYKDGKNYHFTYELHTKFTYQGGENFTFSGDDDVFVYIDGKRVIDIGGVHTSQTQSVNLDSLGLTVGETYDLDFFFAERHYSQSNFTITTNIELETAPDPDADEDNDGIPNILEGSNQQPSTDSDKDGTPDYKDEDSDNNGIDDKDEVGNVADPSDSDSDGTPNFQDTDDDNNGLDDVEEIGNDPENPDNFDGTDLPDYQDTDDDNDGIDDITEGVTDKDKDGTPDHHQDDIDNDGIDDITEGVEDPDEDNIPNFQDPDSDNNTISDSKEGTEDPDGDGIPNFEDPDNDGDGIKDINEINSDSDGDGEPNTVNNQPNGDVDNDGTPNHLDTDSDGDGIPDEFEKDHERLEPYIKTYAD